MFLSYNIKHIKATDVVKSEFDSVLQDLGFGSVKKVRVDQGGDIKANTTGLYYTIT